MKSRDDGIDIKAERHYEHWLEVTGELAMDAINDALSEWSPDDILDAVYYGGGLSQRYRYGKKAPAIDIIGKLSAAIAYLKSLDAEDSIRVALLMRLPGDWEYSEDWDARSL